MPKKINVKNVKPLARTVMELYHQIVLLASLLSTYKITNVVHHVLLDPSVMMLPVLVINATLNVLLALVL